MLKNLHSELLENVRSKKKVNSYKQSLIKTGKIIKSKKLNFLT